MLDFTVLSCNFPPPYAISLSMLSVMCSEFAFLDTFIFWSLKFPYLLQCQVTPIINKFGLVLYSSI